MLKDSLLKIQGNRLDLDYLHRMAATLDVTDLLERALKKTPIDT